MVFIVKKVDLPTFGEKLKKIREEAGLTKQKVAQLLNIQINYLERIEDGRIEKLPADVYTKGFLRKYAKILSINSEELITEYDKETKISRSFDKKQYFALPSIRVNSFTLPLKTLGIILVVSFFILTCGYLFYQLNILISPPKLIILEPLDNVVADQATTVVKGQTELGVQLTINGQQTYINKDGSFEQEINLSQGLNLIKIKAVNRFEKSSSVTRRVLVK